MWEALGVSTLHCKALMTPKSCPAQRLSVDVTNLVMVSHHVICAREGAHTLHDCQKDIHSASEGHQALGSM